ncbi:tRNA uridine-5-carboxymethylaminomethyl(34) synthesis enzyme MnmG [Hippea jasoniae]|uniref:tRNA uridine-5-carboxymethylaminomethyl(34) synthesis enzyme MnmG n=1 Tax=Hippea jasoniae TaxID=944479 RepID=UPI000554F607|nr:tRNA uridine-5-carboxymethylaminomethyl(34) synthesis enzyme MnmG [Hippea jasoniae]
MIYPKNYDVIVIGGGHAGIEAALINARLGLKTLLLTIYLDSIGQMSCNPAIGGLAKGHLVKEVDIFGGEMARCIDATGLQFKILNKSKGPAVWSSRAQADMTAYKLRMKYTLERQENLDIKQETADEILVEDNRVVGVKTNLKNEYLSKAVVVTTGTFMKGKIFIGLETFEAGRAWEPPSIKLSDSLRSLGLKIGRLKTGTTPRLDARTIDFDAVIPQPGDEDPIPFSFRTQKLNRPNIPCYLTYTNEKTHEIILKNLDQSPLYSGLVDSVGPRYCPSIEDKVVKFFEKKQHQIFLEPEDEKSTEIYADGLHTSMSYEVQLKFLRSIRGLEQVEILRPGYAIEYDFVIPTQLKHTLETKKIKGLFLAGQINGTSGYEEAAAQGIVAGINAAFSIMGKEPFIVRRDEAYTGVLIDDLVTKGTKEPYRMFTSRAEYRLILREDNTHLRLAEKSFKAGLLKKEEYEMVIEQKRKIEETIKKLKTTYIYPTAETNEKLKKLGTEIIKTKTDLAKLLRRTEMNYDKLRELKEELEELDSYIKQEVEIDIKYEGYLNLQKQQIDKFKKYENMRIPPDFDYTKVGGLSNEVRGKLMEIKPSSIGQAMRIPGVTPAAVSILMVYIKKHNERLKNTA